MRPAPRLGRALSALGGLLAALLAALWPLRAGADAADLFGPTARERGTANASGPTAAGYQAALENPAGAALIGRPVLGVGYGGAVPRLRIGNEAADVLAPRGIDLGLLVPARVDRVELALAVALHIPDTLLARVHLVPATEPRFVLLENYPSRIIVSAVGAVRPLPWLSLGAGVQFLADVAGNGVTFDLGVSQGRRVSQAALNVALPLRTTPIAGLWVRPHPRLRLGVSYRGELSLRLQLDVVARVNIADVYTGDARIGLLGEDYFTPRRLSGGLAFDVLPELTAYASVVWWGWSGLSRAVADLNVTANLGLEVPLVRVAFGPPGFGDTVSPRVGLEWRPRLRSARAHAHGLALALRAGYGFEPTPVPDQTGATTLVDSDRHVVAAGLGLEWRLPGEILSQPLALDLAVQWHHLEERLTLKEDPSLPGARLSSGGDLVHLGATLNVRF